MAGDHGCPGWHCMNCWPFPREGYGAAATDVFRYIGFSFLTLIYATGRFILRWDSLFSGLEYGRETAIILALLLAINVNKNDYFSGSLEEIGDIFPNNT